MNNRFSRRARLQSTYQPITPTVNFDLLAKSLQTQQNTYDKALEAYSKVPDYIRESDQASAEAKAYREGQQQRIQNMTDAFVSGGIQKGNIARKEGMRSLLQDFQPGGVANKLENDAKLYQEYRKSIEDNKDLTAEVKQAAVAKSLQDYEAGYGNSQPFSGYKAQKYVDVQSKLDKLADGFESDVREGTALINGRTVGKTMNGQYFYTDTDKQEIVPYADVRNFVISMAMTDPEIRSFNNQEDELFGGEFQYSQRYKDKDGKIQEKKIPMSRSQYAMNVIADGLANKYSFMKQTTKRDIREDYIYKMNQKFARDKRLKEMDIPDAFSGHQERDVVNSGLNLPITNIASTNNAKILAKLKPSRNSRGRVIQNTAYQEVVTELASAKTAEKEQIRKQFKDGKNSRGRITAPGYQEALTELDNKYAKLEQERTKSFVEEANKEVANQTIEHFTSVEGRKSNPNLAYRLDENLNSRRTIVDKEFPNGRSETDYEVLLRSEREANAMANELNKNVVITQNYSDSEAEKKYKYYTNSNGVNNHLWSMVDGPDGFSEPQDLKLLLEDNLGISFGDGVEGQKTFNDYLKTSLAATGRLTPGQNVPQSAVPTGDVISISVGEDEDAKTIRFVATPSRERSNLAEQIKSFTAPLTKPHTVVNPELGKGYGGIISDVVDTESGPQNIYFVTKARVDYQEENEKIINTDTTPEVYQIRRTVEGEQGDFGEGSRWKVVPFSETSPMQPKSRFKEIIYNNEVNTGYQQ